MLLCIYINEYNIVMPDDSRAALRAAMKKYKEAAPETKSAGVRSKSL